MNSHSDHTLHFEAVNSRNRAEVEHLEVFAEQSGFIESVTQCLQEADKLELWRPVGIYDRGMLIGFAMYGYFPEPAPGRTEYSCDTIYLSVYETNSHAIHLYQQIGFHFNGEYDTNGEHVMVYAF